MKVLASDGLWKRSAIAGVLIAVATLLVLFIPERDRLYEFYVEPMERRVIPFTPVPVAWFDRKKWLDAAKDRFLDGRNEMSKQLVSSGWLINRSGWEVKTLLGLPDSHNRGGFAMPSKVAPGFMDVEEVWIYFVDYENGGLEGHELEVGFRGGRVATAFIRRWSHGFGYSL